MKISYKKSLPARAKGDALILPTFSEKEEADLSPWKSVDKATGGRLSKQSAKEGFKADAGSSFSIDGKHTDRIVLLGLGNRNDFTADTLRRALGKLIPHLENARLTDVTISLPQKAKPELVRAAAEAVILGSYRFDVYLKSGSRPSLKQVVIAGREPSSAAIRRSLRTASAGAKATNAARDLVNEPPLTLTPREFAKRARKLEGRGVKVKVIGKAQLKKMGARALLGVSQGSSEPPCLIELRYKPEKSSKRSKKKLAVVGKGITFDSGGLSLKPAQGMETMKCDMGGGAAVFGLFHALRQVQPAVEVVGVIAASENMPDASAQKPGDIVKAMNGKTIEILNTDAEGRLVLADALHYVEKKHKPDAIVDLATLTGAIVVALGESRAAVYGSNEGLTAAILDAGKTAGECFWHMPLDTDLRSKLKSPVADIKNIGDRWGGSITAALFLQEFVDKTPWVHLDIAGPAFTASAGTTIPGPAGGSGFAVRTLLEWVQNAQ